MAANNNLSDFLTSVANALRSKGGTDQPINAQDFPSVIANLPSGGGVQDVESKDIDFYDFRGNRVASWTLAELADKTELPAAPTHDGFTFQSWNWTLEQIKAQNRPLNIGELCCTSDGVTRLYVHVNEEQCGSRKYVRLVMYSTKQMTVNWGDGNSETSAEGGQLTHTYDNYGDYVISISCEGNMSVGGGTTSYRILTNSSAQTMTFRGLYKIEFSANVYSIATDSISGYSELLQINMPAGCTIANGNEIYLSGCGKVPVVIISGGTIANATGCYAAKAYCFGPSQTKILSLGLGCADYPRFPSTITSMAGVSVYDTWSRFVYPNITAIPANSLKDKKSLTHIVVPATVTSIGASAFYSTWKVVKVRFEGTVPPTLASTNVFSSSGQYNGGSTKVISVPTGCLEAYQNATNYPTSFTYIEED